MKNKHMKTVILLLVGLVLFTSSLSLLMYKKQADLKEESEKVKFVEMYITTKDIKQGEMLGAESIQKASFPQEYLVGAPLTASEIIGRYAIVDIFKSEPIREQKISLSKPEDKTIKQDKPGIAETLQKLEEGDELKDTITLPLSVFKNVDSSLKKGDKIDIVSVKAKQDGREQDFKVNYIALNVKIDAFVQNGKQVNNFVSYVKDKKNNTIASYAENIILEISPKELKNFLTLYYKTLSLNGNRLYNTNNRGHLWIVKCALNEDAETKKQKKKMLADYTSKVQRSVRQVKRVASEASISYED